MQTDESIISQTISWISKVVIGCNFCPFAARELKRGTVHYEVVRSENRKDCLQALALEFNRLDQNDSIETSFLIFSDAFTDFYKYLDLVDLSEKMLSDIDYDGIYQLASFHPEYLFAGASAKDAANYTNRSPFPMIQVLREASITKALESYPEPDKIPERNIEYAREKGLDYMKQLKASALTGSDLNEPS